MPLGSLGQGRPAELLGRGWGWLLPGTCQGLWQAPMQLAVVDALHAWTAPMLWHAMLRCLGGLPRSPEHTVTTC